MQVLTSMETVAGNYKVMDGKIGQKEAKMQIMEHKCGAGPAALLRVGCVSQWAHAQSAASTRACQNACLVRAGVWIEAGEQVGGSAERGGSPAGRALYPSPHRSARPAAGRQVSIFVSLRRAARAAWTRCGRRSRRWSASGRRWARWSVRSPAARARARAPSNMSVAARPARCARGTPRGPVLACAAHRSWQARGSCRAVGGARACCARRMHAARRQEAGRVPPAEAA